MSQALAADAPGSVMRAVVLTGHGDMDMLEYRENWPRPDAGKGEVLVRVRACGLNNTDVNTRIGWYSKGAGGATGGGAAEGANAEDSGWGGAALSFPRIQGADVAGVVEEAGSSDGEPLIGQRVLIDTWMRDADDPGNPEKTGYLGSERDGGFAEYVAVPRSQVHPINSDLSDAELATFATSYLTAENMLNRAGVRKGDAMLVTGASGGVGGALIQLANRRGAQVVAMCGEAKAGAVRSLNPAAVLPRAPADLSVALREAIGRDSVDVVADVVGGEEFPRWIDALARRGRYVVSGAIAGPEVTIDLRTLYLRDLTFYGSTVPPDGVFADVVGYIERGEIRPVLAQSFPLEKLRDAQEMFLQKAHVGNIVVEMAS